MAKAATKKTTKASKISKPAKGPTAKSSKAPAKPVKAAKAPVAKNASSKAKAPEKKRLPARAPVISKEELRGQIEKLTSANATLKAKGRETAKALRASEARVTALEHQISQIEARSVIADKSTENVKSRRWTRAPEPGDQPAPEIEDNEEPDTQSGS